MSLLIKTSTNQISGNTKHPPRPKHQVISRIMKKTATILCPQVRRLEKFVSTLNAKIDSNALSAYVSLAELLFIKFIKTSFAYFWIKWSTSL